MTCAKGHRIPDEALACPYCAQERGEQAFHTLQLEFLRKTVNGEANYTLRIVKDAQRHVLMYSSFTRTFCGKELATQPRIAYEPYDADTLSKVCAGCRMAIKAAVQEAMAQ